MDSETGGVNYTSTGKADPPTYAEIDGEIEATSSEKTQHVGQ